MASAARQRQRQVPQQIEGCIARHRQAVGRATAAIGSAPASGAINLVRVGERWENGQKSLCYDLIAGLHRLEACRALGHAEIAISVSDLAEIDRQIWECDENLARANLTPTAEARFLLRRKELYEIKYPETRREATLKQNRTDNLSERTAPSFAADTSAKTGETERTVRRTVRRAEKIADDVLDQNWNHKSSGQPVVACGLERGPGWRSALKLAEILALWRMGWDSNPR